MFYHSEKLCFHSWSKFFNSWNGEDEQKHYLKKIVLTEHPVASHKQNQMNPFEEGVALNKI